MKMAYVLAIAVAATACIAGSAAVLGVRAPANPSATETTTSNR